VNFTQARRYSHTLSENNTNARKTPTPEKTQQTGVLVSSHLCAAKTTSLIYSHRIRALSV